MIETVIFWLLYPVGVALEFVGFETSLTERDEAKADGRNWTPPR